MSRNTPRQWWRRQITKRAEPVRQRFERNRGNFRQLRRELNQARIGRTYDDYLTEIAISAISVGLATALLVFGVTNLLGVVVGTDPTVLLGRGLVEWVPSLGGAVGVSGLSPPILLAVDVLGASLVGAVAGFTTWRIGYTRPSRIAHRRAVKLDATLPSTVSYMYALAHGGLDPIEVVRRTSQREDIYGEQAREMRLVINEMEYLGADFVTALQHAAELTPCQATADFLGDMVSVLESGGDFEAFLDDYRQQHVADLTGEQESFLEQLGLYAELYVTLLVAAPLFVIILLLIIGILGSPASGAVNALVYVGLPLGTALFLLFLDRVNQPFTAGGRVQSAEETATPVPDDPDAQAYADRKRRLERIERLKHPFEAFVQSPLKTLYVTVPLAAVALAGIVLLGVVQPTPGAFLERPLTATTLLLVVPFLVLTGPLAVFYEIKRRFADRVRQRFPEVLAAVARANKSGISIGNAIGKEAERSGGVIGTELAKLRNDIRWFNDASEAFLRLASRARLRTTTMTMRLVAEANAASGSLYRTLTVAADDARFRSQFVESREREVGTYVAVAIISFLVFLAIILMVQQFFLERVVEAAAQSGESAIGPEVPGSLQNIDVRVFRLAFLHATVVQGACIGLVAGKLSRGSALAGVKYSIGMVLVSIVAFGVI